MLQDGKTSTKAGNSDACSLELSAAYFQPASGVFLSHKSVNNIFSCLFSAQANRLLTDD
jgi:hypothetical protein